eukprot:m.23716 g.23716  ORF g.23716 m.23716 type:complete len:563 (+) comp28520_c0_seq2:194-1882(+)
MNSGISAVFFTSLFFLHFGGTMASVDLKKAVRSHCSSHSWTIEVPETVVNDRKLKLLDPSCNSTKTDGKLVWKIDIFKKRCGSLEKREGTKLLIVYNKVIFYSDMNDSSPEADVEVSCTFYTGLGIGGEDPTCDLKTFHSKRYEYKLPDMKLYKLKKKLVEKKIYFNSKYLIPSNGFPLTQWNSKNGENQLCFSFNRYFSCMIESMQCSESVSSPAKGSDCVDPSPLSVKDNIIVQDCYAHPFEKPDKTKIASYPHIIRRGCPDKKADVTFMTDQPHGPDTVDFCFNFDQRYKFDSIPTPYTFVTCKVALCVPYKHKPIFYLPMCSRLARSTQLECIDMSRHAPEDTTIEFTTQAFIVKDQASPKSEEKEKERGSVKNQTSPTFEKNGSEPRNDSVVGNQTFTTSKVNESDRYTTDEPAANSTVTTGDLEEKDVIDGQRRRPKPCLKPRGCIKNKMLQRFIKKKNGDDEEEESRITESSSLSPVVLALICTACFFCGLFITGSIWIIHSHRKTIASLLRENNTDSEDGNENETNETESESSSPSSPSSSIMPEEKFLPKDCP